MSDSNQLQSITIIGAPFDENSSFLRGAAQAPSVIRKAIYTDSSNMWTENGVDLGSNSRIIDAGDLKEFNQIEQQVADVLQKSGVPVVLGGDHSITYPVIKGFSKFYSKLSILHFDAHPDLYDNFENNPHSHASPFARIMERGLAARLVQLGIRTANRHQKEQAARFGVEMIEMKDWYDDALISFDEPFYISFDMDALDPSCAPGVSHPEGGGLTTRQAVRLIQSVRGRVVGADIVELNPIKDVAGITAAACAKIFKEIAGRICEV